MDPLLTLIVVAVALVLILAVLNRIDIGVALLVLFAALVLWVLLDGRVT